MKNYLLFSKKRFLFAVSNNLKSGIVRLLFIAGFFYACMPVYGVAPVWNCNRTTAAFQVLDNGSVTPFFRYHSKF